LANSAGCAASGYFKHVKKNIECSAADTTRRTLTFKRICVSSCTAPFGSRRSSLDGVPGEGRKQELGTSGTPQPRWVCFRPGRWQLCRRPGRWQLCRRACLIVSFCMKLSIHISFISLLASRAFLGLQGPDVLAVQAIGMSSTPGRKLAMTYWAYCSVSSKVSTGYSLDFSDVRLFEFSPRRHYFWRTRF